MENEIMVSVNCITYNHEKYIADAIDSFLMQKTNFRIEILIHDDASTDNTASIIREYQKKHPDIIKPIFQEKNQYSQGVNVIDINLARAKGRYIASCEGDDFWVNPNKLQKQFDFMEQHPECSLYAHSAYRAISRDKARRKGIKLSNKDCYFTIEDILKMPGGVIPTNSMFYPAKFARNRPDFINIVVDFPLTIYLALNGNIYYNREFLSAYRINAVNSWTDCLNQNPKAQLEHLKSRIKTLNEIDKYTNYTYSKIIEEHRKLRYLYYYISGSNNNNSVAIFNHIKTFKHELNFTQKTLIIIKSNFPKTILFLKKAIKQFYKYPLIKI